MSNSEEKLGAAEQRMLRAMEQPPADDNGNPRKKGWRVGCGWGDGADSKDACERLVEKGLAARLVGTQGNVTYRATDQGIAWLTTDDRRGIGSFFKGSGA